MSIEQIKAELPDVKVNFLGKEFIGRVRGRKLSFASVSFGDTFQHSCDWSWSAIERAVNNNIALMA